MELLTEAEKYIVLELLSSSSSDDDELDFLDCPKEVIPKIDGFIENVVHLNTDAQFKSNFRITRETACELIDHYEHSQFYPKENNALATSTSAENHILSFLWFAGNKSCLRDVAQRFGIGTTTLFRQIIRVADFLVDIAPELITFPKEPEDKESAALNFHGISGFPNVLGVIDGSAIAIRTPAHKIKSTYCNRHDMPSITLQGICDSRRRFIDVFIGAPGKIHDARVYKFSDISTRLPAICGKKFHILGDGAYAIREWLITPYRDSGHLTPSQTAFNSRFSATRVLIENAFGLLKGRFRQLQELHIHNVNKITKFILALCVLHNFCINKEDLLDSEYMDEHHAEIGEVVDNEIRLRRTGEEKRNVLKDSFNYL